jgi:beta-lactamase class A
VGTYGNYGIVIKNLKTGEQYSLQENTEYEAASLYKLWVMAEVYEQIKNGMLSDDDVLSEDVAVLNEKFQIPSESAELKDGKITLSVHDALEKMINISDNYAALLLTEKIRLPTISLFLKDNGFSQSSIGEDGKLPMTTPHDIALFFEKLYNGQLIDPDYSNKMISLLEEQKLNDKIPKYLPDAIAVAHKTGELDAYTHDAGIVYANGYDYIIVVLSKSDNPELAAIRIANVSEAVYNYFERK